MTDASGNVIKNYDYDAFGNEKNPDPNDTNVFRYSGEYFDKETGTIYLRARYYDPGIGRFTSEDSVWSSKIKLANGQEIDDSLSLNLYTYCGNNPTILVDPSGHLWIQVGAGLAKGTWNVVAQLYTDVGTGKWSSKGTYIGNFAGGFVGGVLTTVPGTKFIADAAESVVTSVVKHAIDDGKKFDAAGAFYDAIIDFGASKLGGGASNFVGNKNASRQA